MTSIKEACGIKGGCGCKQTTGRRPVVDLKILDQRINDHKPAYATAGSAGFDLRACIDEPIVLQPGQTVPISAGIALHLASADLVAMIYPRSGLGTKHGIVLGNLVGVADSDYQGPITIAAWNRSLVPYTIQPMERIAQLVIVPVVQVDFNVVDEFSTETERGAGGFGSTGSK